MFFREKTSRHSKPVLQLVENIRTEKGSRQKLIVSLGTKLSIPKEKRSHVARIVKERLTGEQSLLIRDPELIVFADKIVKRIQTEGKWTSARKQVCKIKEDAGDSATAEIFVDDVQHGYNRELGPVLIGHRFWNLLNFPDILKECGFSDSQLKNAEISILNRLIAQDSEHSIVSWTKTAAIDDILGIDTRKYGDDRFYRISDILLKNQEYIEEDLYERERKLFNLQDSIFLYDLTNTYFEGICAQNPKAEYNGNQKEKRTDCPQVVVALVINQDGFIKRHRIFNGKMTDVKSLKKILDDLKNDFKNKPMPTIIFDRGMVSEDNINLLKEYKNLKYIIACRPNEESFFIEDFKNEPFSPLSGRESSGKPKVEIFLKKVEDVTYLLCKSDGRMVKEKAMRNKREEKLESDLNNLSNQITKGRENNPVNIERCIGRLKERHRKVAKYFDIEYQHREFSYTLLENMPKRLNNSLQNLKEKVDTNKISFPALKKKLSSFEEKYTSHFQSIRINLVEPSLTWHTIDELEEKERELDGNYLLKTNRSDLNQHEIWNIYMMLTRVENAFRDLKSYLGLRPNYHHKEKRVDGHIFISILAYHLLHSIEHTLQKMGDHSRWSTIRRLVSSHTYSTIQLPTVKGPVINVRKPGIPEGIHIDIYQKLEVTYENLPITKTYA
ncbi:IS1634 family transposase [Thermodesulfobacteriota bacterium]